MKNILLVPSIFFLAGLCGTVTGTLLPELENRFNVVDSGLVALILLWNLGIIAGSVLINLMLSRLKLSVLLVSLYLLVAGGLVVMGTAVNFVIYLFAYSILAFAFGCLVTYGHTAASHSHSSVASGLSIGEVSIGLGYAFTPVYFYLVDLVDVEWGMGLTLMSALPIFFMSLIPEDGELTKQIPTARPSQHQTVRPKYILEMTLLLLFFSSLGMTFLEWGQNTWNVYYLTEGLALDSSLSKLVFATFSIAMVVSRLGNVWLVRMYPLYRLLVLSLILVCCGIALIAASHKSMLLIAGNVLFGLGIGPLVPNVMALVLQNRTEFAPVVSNSMVIGGAVGSFLGGWLLNIEVQRGNILLIYIPILLAVALMLAITVHSLHLFVKRYM